ncbi:MAG: HD domain-containing protein [Firmicutes bacterium]|nr:HD domain-containing protein [Bacillota bacterium]
MSEGEKVFKDPVHGYIYVRDPVIWDLINTREMQRLRRIRQLGTTYFAYPGGDHSRFSHSLGVYEVIRQMIQAFDRNGYAWPHDYDRLVMVAGLLHDVGHAPFSHALERLMQRRHEWWSVAVIEDESTEVHQVLESVEAGFAKAVAAVIAKEFPSSLAVSLVSGQLDADRLDYLMRDSLATGVDYGKFDLARIIRVLQPVDGRLVVRQSALHTVEAYLLARYFMYWQVYFHPVSRAGEVLLRGILERARNLVLSGKPLVLPHPALLAFLRGEATLDQYLALDDTILYAAFAVWQRDEDVVLSDLCQRFLHRRLFKEIPWSARASEWMETLKARVAAYGYDPQYYCVVDETSTVYYDYYLGRDREPSHNEAIWLYDKRSGKLTEVSSVSLPIQAIAQEHRPLRRIYVPEEVWRDQEVEEIMRRDDEANG